MDEMDSSFGFAARRHPARAQKLQARCRHRDTLGGTLGDKSLSTTSRWCQQLPVEEMARRSYRAALRIAHIWGSSRI